MRSYFGCLICKGRKLKCDEAKPACCNCMKASRDCTYADQSIFRSQTPRRKQTNRVSWSGKQQPDLFDEDHIWVEVPSKLTFVQVEDPWALDNDTSAGTEGDTDRGTDIGVEKPTLAVMKCQTMVLSNHSLQHARTLDATQENTPLVYPPENFDLDPFNRAIASHLLRHFQQGPGRWYV